ncbi:hypothetical protein FE845_09845 [Marinobacter sp. 1-4A]|uniref:hypothetical protein n=1 Tax=Marinobacter sp. 1-4A TaxID=2582919 RepID=UPI0019043832|nr:hypothetical protein [Marinobacter sp. 1-4A]MBK1851644.1 hypothetical protein [Marinobacter sp. 1-4A]
MSTKILCSNQEIQSDPELRAMFDVPVGLLDPNHISIDENLKKQILRDRYHNKLIADGLETGRFFYGVNGQLQFRTGLQAHSFAGYIFEAYAVQCFNDNKQTIGRNAFIWSTKRQQPNQTYVDQFKAIGTGFITTSSSYPQFYNPQHQLDVRFIRKKPKTEIYEPATQQGTTVGAGIQIKAITGNERTEIIDPLLSGKYTHILTFLRHADGVHSYERCMQIVKKLFKDGVIGLHERNKLEDGIRNPESLGMDQRNIDDYYQYILYWFNGRAEIDQNIYDGIGLEVKGYKYANGLLVPEDE